ncbi:MAG TPA: hypothetical protein VK988_09630, partial [Acidimicrobiales bacterium]|nr:hypothetical protein [Acidimicrobiales bacterium]
MARRIEVELTSKREDGRWTWRAAGAKQPRGELDGSLLYEGAKIGDVVRAEADFEIDGILVTSVLPPKERKRSEPERVEIIGPPRDERGVTSSLTGKPERTGPDRPRRADDARGPGRRERSGREEHGRGDESARRDQGVRRPAGARTPRTEDRSARGP